MAGDRIILPEDSVVDDDEKIVRTGNLWSTVAHIITAVIGSGVLSLAWSTSQLGWIGGPVALFSFAFVTYVSSSLISDCYRSPDPVTGTRNRSYTDAVTVILGEKQAWVCGLLQYLSFYGTALAHIITGVIESGFLSLAWSMAQLGWIAGEQQTEEEGYIKREGALWKTYLFGQTRWVIKETHDLDC